MEGTVTVGADGAALQKLHLKSGTRVRADLGEMGLRTGRFVANPDDIDLTVSTLPTDVLLTGNLQLEGISPLQPTLPLQLSMPAGMP